MNRKQLNFGTNFGFNNFYKLLPLLTLQSTRIQYPKDLHNLSNVCDEPL